MAFTKLCKSKRPFVVRLMYFKSDIDRRLVAQEQKGLSRTQAKLTTGELNKC
ncbi:hypothetical protein CROQUDRAFT_657659, partial [Cronartium quercuum f. sp. fusiforme G11]